MATHRTNPFRSCAAPALAAVALAAAALTSADALAAAGADVEKGRAIAEESCSGCHAIGPTGESPLPEAPAFRTLGQRYPVESLQEALAEGIVTGHPDMPEVAWDPDTIALFLAYLASIQTPAGQ